MSISIGLEVIYMWTMVSAYLRVHKLGSIRTQEQCEILLSGVDSSNLSKEVGGLEQSKYEL